MDVVVWGAVVSPHCGSAARVIVGGTGAADSHRQGGEGSTRPPLPPPSLHNPHRGQSVTPDQPPPPSEGSPSAVPVTLGLSYQRLVGLAEALSSLAEGYWGTDRDLGHNITRDRG